MAGKENRLQERVDNLQKQIDEIEAVRKIYPDVQVNSDRWNHERHFSALANKDVDEVDFRHSCGCCQDAPLFAWPYVELEDGTKVFSDPPKFYIADGVGDFGIGERPDPDYEWMGKLKVLGIQEKVRGKIAVYLNEHPPKYCGDDDWDDDEDDDD